MKIFFILVAIVVGMAACFSLLPAKASAEGAPKVLVIPREGYSQDIVLMLEKEVGLMRRMLGRAGFKVDVATASGIRIVSPGIDLEPDLKLVDVKAADYVGVIMPCMAVGGIPGPPVAPEAVAIVKKVAAEGKPIAAQFGSVPILARAGVLKGKKYSYLDDPLKPTWYRKHTDPNFDGAIYSGRDVVQDGNIITSSICPYIEKVTGIPTGTAKLTQAFIDELKKK
jgi:putative intracellular protease/amidase